MDDVGHAHSAAVSQNRTQGFDHTQKNDGYHRNQEDDDRNLGLLAERRGVDHFFFLVPTQYKGAIGNTPLELGVICKFLASLHHNKAGSQRAKKGSRNDNHQDGNHIYAARLLQNPTSAAVAAASGVPQTAFWLETTEAAIGRSGRTPFSMAISLMMGSRLHRMWPVPQQKQTAS